MSRGRASRRSTAGPIVGWSVVDVRGRVVAIALAVLMAACGSRPPSPTPVVEDRPGAVVKRSTSGAAAYEQRLHDSAVAQVRANRLAEAATSWEILTVLKPDSLEYREQLREVRRLVDAAFAEKLARADAAQKKGDFDAATTQYLGALALDPSNGRAADGLRGVERERNRRTVLGKASRLVLTKRSIADSQAIAPSVVVPLDGNELEVATMLGKQGEYDDAIGLLEARLAVDKSDSNARLLLAGLYAQKAEKRLPRDRPGAVAALEKSVRLDPSNSAVVARLRQLNTGSGGAARPASPSRAASSARLVSAPTAATPAAGRVARPARAASGPGVAASGAARVAPMPAMSASGSARAAPATASAVSANGGRAAASSATTPATAIARAASAIGRPASASSGAASASRRSASTTASSLGAATRPGSGSAPL